jgi:diketogulonate reductase-like aldo/keto reductase
MKYRKFGSSGKDVPIIGQGTWQFPTRRDEIEEAISALRAGLDAGMTHIDTAEMYGNGESEKIIAKAVKDYPREDLFIVSKVLPSNASRKGTIKACEKSLQRLEVDYIDCYLLHWRSSYPLEETMEAFEELVQSGKVKSVGVSNFDVEDIKEAQQYLRKTKLACNQVLYNLHTRGIEHSLIPYCESESIAVVGYTPFAQRSVPSAKAKQGEVLHSIATKYGATPHQIILAFLTRRKSCFAIPKAAKVRHAIENAAAGDFQLNAEEIAAIDAAFPAPKSDVPLEML